MKLPDGNTPPPAPRNEQSPVQAPREAGSPGAGQSLDRLGVADRQAVVARVAELIRNQGGPQALLELRGQTLRVDLPANAPPLAAGDLVSLVRDGHSLQLLGTLPQPAELLVSQALARHLPWQHNLASGLQQLFSLLTSGTRSGPAGLPGSSEPLSPAARSALLDLLRLLPGQNTLTGSGAAGTQMTGDSPASAVRQWLLSSGLFTEAQLAQGQSPLKAADLKLALGRVAHSLLQQQGLDIGQFARFTPLASPELSGAPLQFPSSVSFPVTPQSAEPATVGQALRLLAGMLNRLTVNQLHSQLLTGRGGEGAGPAGSWLMDLPWLNPQGEPRLAQLRLEQEWLPEKDRESGKDSSRAGVSEWRFTLVMNLDQSGPLTFEVALRRESLSARVWAEHPDTARQVSQQLNTLRQSLQELGLEVTALECRRGTPPASVTRLEHRLIDIRA